MGLKAIHLHRVNMQPLKAARQGGTARVGTEKAGAKKRSNQRCSKTSPESRKALSLLCHTNAVKHSAGSEGCPRRRCCQSWHWKAATEERCCCQASSGATEASGLFTTEQKLCRRLCSSRQASPTAMLFLHKYTVCAVALRGTVLLSLSGGLAGP